MEEKKRRDINLAEGRQACSPSCSSDTHTHTDAYVQYTVRMEPPPRSILSVSSGRRCHAGSRTHEREGLSSPALCSVEKRNQKSLISAV